HDHIIMSLEMRMKCGIGLCGSCDCGGQQVCRDGPVFTGQQIERLDDFGKFKRDKTGKKVGF
ncbi:MAG: dihydroorotate dehydrogenase electron transfer subunit, partial [Thermoplasmata archaeon]|nr:dihydroorotate dehydrogenase electron transfer subunit [Thermoplasmata archaeon]